MKHPKKSELFSRVQARWVSSILRTTTSRRKNLALLLKWVHTDEEEKDKLTTKRQKKTHFKRQKKGINILLLF